MTNSSMEAFYGQNNKDEKPFEFYLKKFKRLSPAEISKRTALSYDGKGFLIRLMGQDFSVSFPDCAVEGIRKVTNKERILFLRYLVDGYYNDPGDVFLPFQELTWGEVYIRQFTARAINRFAYSYGSRPWVLEKILTLLPARSLKSGDLGFDLEFMKGLRIRFILWFPDEEFPASAQVLFSDNFKQAFTAEDVANIGDIVLDRMKSLESLS